MICCNAAHTSAKGAGTAGTSSADLILQVYLTTVHMCCTMWSSDMHFSLLMAAAAACRRNVVAAPASIFNRFCHADHMTATAPAARADSVWSQPAGH